MKADGASLGAEVVIEGSTSYSLMSSYRENSSVGDRGGEGEAELAEVEEAKVMSGGVGTWFGVP